MSALFLPGQSVRDGSDNGIVVSTSAMSVRVYFTTHGVVDYLQPLSERDVAPAGVKTTQDLMSASSAQELAVLLLQMFLAKKPFAIQDGKISVLENGRTFQLEAGGIDETIEAIKVFL